MKEKKENNGKLRNSVCDKLILVSLKQQEIIIMIKTQEKNRSLHLFHSGFLFAGLQQGFACFCGDTYGKYGSVQEESCDTPCTGDPAQICGSTRINSIYSTGLGCKYNENDIAIIFSRDVIYMFVSLLCD